MSARRVTKQTMLEAMAAAKPMRHANRPAVGVAIDALHDILERADRKPLTELQQGAAAVWMVSLRDSARVAA